jgi:hypothetical protein
MLVFCAVGFVPNEIFATGRARARARMLVNMQKVRSKKTRRDSAKCDRKLFAATSEAALLPQPSFRVLIAEFRDYSRSKPQSAKA